MAEVGCDVLIVGGGTGGCAAAMAAVSLGLSVVLTEETDWVGGQLTAQCVPPDEHPWIEQFGSTARYRAYREGVRAFYRDHTPLLPAHRADPRLNPGSGWVSRLCHEPRIGWMVLNQMLTPGLASGRLDLRLRTILVGATAEGDRVESVTVRSLETGADTVVRPRFVLDATELGDLLPLTGTEYVVGAESRDETLEPNAVEGPAQPDNVQGITWCFPMALDEGSHRVIDRPADYDRWRSYVPSCQMAPLLSWHRLHPHTNEEIEMGLFRDEPFAMFSYRQVVEPSRFAPGYHPHPATIVNWPQNDYFLGSVVDIEPYDPAVRARTPLADGPVSEARLRDSAELSRCLLYWMQTEAPRHDGGVGYPGLYLRPDLSGTADGLAKTAYIRESRRIRARFTVLEQHVAAYTNPGQDQAVRFDDSVGVGGYRIDLHPSTNGVAYIDTSSLPFQIPLGALVPVRMENLLPAAKNLGVTHITNGCYRLHPVEWNIGESAGLLAGFCLQGGFTPTQVWESAAVTADFQRLLEAQGVELDWPRLRAM